MASNGDSNNMEKLVVIDFLCQEVEIHIYNISSDIEIDEEFIEKLVHDTNHCQWAFGTKVDIVKHKRKILK